MWLLTALASECRPCAASFFLSCAVFVPPPLGSGIRVFLPSPSLLCPFAGTIYALDPVFSAWAVNGFMLEIFILGATHIARVVAVIRSHALCSYGIKAVGGTKLGAVFLGQCKKCTSGVGVIWRPLHPHSRLDGIYTKVG